MITLPLLVCIQLLLGLCLKVDVRLKITLLVCLCASIQLIVTGLFCGHWHSLSPLGEVVGQCMWYSSGCLCYWQAVRSNRFPPCSRCQIQGWDAGMVLVCQTSSWTSGKLHNVSPKQCEISRLVKYIGNISTCTILHDISANQQTTMQFKHVYLPTLLCLCRYPSSSNGLWLCQ